MKKYFLVAGIVVLFGLYILFAKKQSSSTVVSNTSGSGSASAGSKTANPAPSGSGNSPASAGAFKDGSYTGSATQSIYGTVQVRATVSGGKLTNVEYVQYPNDRHESERISMNALPKLVSEAVASQNANVDSVSGATQTSEGFAQSLASALAQAQ